MCSFDDLLCCSIGGRVAEPTDSFRESLDAVGDGELARPGDLARGGVEVGGVVARSVD